MGIGTLRRYYVDATSTPKPKYEYTKEDVEEMLRRQAEQVETPKKVVPALSPVAKAEVVEVKPVKDLVEAESVEVKPVEFKIPNALVTEPVPIEKVKPTVEEISKLLNSEVKPVVEEPKKVGRPPKFIVKTPETKPTE